MLTCQKHLFSLPDGLHYLNCAYMSPTLRRVEAAGVEGLRRQVVPSQIGPQDFFEDSDRVRRCFAQVINAPDPRRIVIIPSVSYGVAIAARNTPFRRGQNIVVAHEQFPSNVYAWRSTCQREGLELRTIAPPEGDARRGEAWSARLLQAIDRRTALVALPHVHWTDGTRFDLDQIGQRARECGAALVVDGTQSVGALPFDVQRVQPDALICAGYKWLLGPYSIGLAYFGPRYDDGVPLEETWIGRLGSEDFRGLVNYQDQYQPAALRYDVGERSNFILLRMLRTALEQLLEWGVAEIQTYCRSLTSTLVADLGRLEFSVEAEPWRGAHLLGLRAPPHTDAGGLSSALQQRNVIVSVRGSAIRVSPHVYNDQRDMDALLEVLRDARTGVTTTKGTTSRGQDAALALGSKTGHRNRGDARDRK